MDATWIVSANASRARIFARTGSSAELDEINDMISDAVRLRTAETEPDKIGPLAATKSRHNVGAATPASGYEPHQTPTEHETELFARDLAGFLLQGHQQDRFDKLALIASPQFLGVLRKLLDSQLTSLVQLEINKDYTRASPRELMEHMEAYAAKGS